MPKENTTSQDTDLHEIYPIGAETLASEVHIQRYIPQKERDAIPLEDFAWPEERKYPCDTQDHVDSCATLLGHAPEEKQSSIKSRAIRIAKQHGFSIPDSWKDGDSDKKDDRAATTDEHTMQAPAPAVSSVDEHEHNNDHVQHRADMPTHALLHGDIIRVDKNKWEVEGVATSEAVDTFGTVFSYEASKKAFKNWIERTANVREMHDKKAVGKGIGVRFDDANKKIFVCTRVSRGAPDTWLKVEDGVLSGFSAGATNPVWDKIERNGKTYPYLTSYDLAELSLVDHASNPDAQGLVIARSDGLTEIVDVTPELEEPSRPAAASSPTPALERAGARVSNESMGALHDARNTALKSAMQLMKHCSCPQCTTAMTAFDPDNDGDIDMYGLDDPDGDSQSLASEGFEDTRDAERMAARIQETIERILTPIAQRQQSMLTRFASIETPDTPEFDTELIRSVISAEITTQITTLEGKLTTALERASTASSLDEVRSVLTEVKGQVERIANTPMPGGPLLNGAYPVDKHLANDPRQYAQQAPNGSTVREVLDKLQAAGALNTIEAQTAAASLLIQPMPGRRG